MSTGNKRGRPFKDDSLRHDMKVRIDDETHKKLTQYSDENKITIAETIRKAIRSFLEK